MMHTLRNADNSLKQRAAQMWCLLRIIPFLIGEYIPRDNCFWELILKLRKITDIVFAPSITRGMCIYLRALIEDHHFHFKEIFPESNLIPKHHFLVHYPTMMLQLGHWCIVGPCVLRLNICLLSGLQGLWHASKTYVKQLPCGTKSVTVGSCSLNVVQQPILS